MEEETAEPSAIATATEADDVSAETSDAEEASNAAADASEEEEAKKQPAEKAKQLADARLIKFVKKSKRKSDVTPKVAGTHLKKRKSADDAPKFVVRSQLDPPIKKRKKRAGNKNKS